jgi:hypothetical protein
MPNKHFCQGPNCHRHPTQDRFLKSRGVLRGRYAYATMDRTPNVEYFVEDMHMQQWTEHLMNMVGFQMVQMFIFVVNHVNLIG